jgi:phosphoglycerate kinase
VSRVPVLEDLGDVSGKRVLVRTDFNVPMEGPDDARVITDDFRIRAALPTIEWLTSRGATVVCASHLGRPKGAPVAKYSMEPVRRRLAELAPGVELLENLRFNAGEEANTPEFAASLIKGIDMYVNDAFGAAHRAHASIVGPPRTLPSAAGRLLEKEVEVMVDSLVIGGGMCFTFLAAKGYPVGDSICELDQIATCRRLLDSGKPIFLPDDLVGLDANGNFATFGQRLPDGAKGLDIGPGSAAAFSDVIMDARTVFWNGPMGMFEDERFAAGTRTVAEAMAATKAFTIVGGGDSAAALAQFKLDDEVDHVSTGGGASLELLELGDLPGLAALRGAPNVK